MQSQLPDRQTVISSMNGDAQPISQPSLTVGVDPANGPINRMKNSAFDLLCGTVRPLNFYDIPLAETEVADVEDDIIGIAVSRFRTLGRATTKLTAKIGHSNN